MNSIEAHVIIFHVDFILQCAKKLQRHIHFAPSRSYLVQRFLRPSWKTFQEKLIKSIVIF